MQIQHPASMKQHVEKVVAGEYDVPFDPIAGTPQRPAGPIVLDIGANVGAFAAWAHFRWPGSTIYCYEPSKANFEYLRTNLSSLPNVHLFNQAVGNPENSKLYLGKNNCGENSFYDLGEQKEEFEEVTTIHPGTLPEAHVLKIDAEGSEMDILSRLDKIDFNVILLEYHKDEYRRRIDRLLNDYLLVGGEARCLHRGTSKYIHKRLA